MATLERYRYLLMTLDPVHIGTGGYRLGRVDNSIVREPGTRVPKIPGTAIHGAVRSYAARLYEDLSAAGKDHDGVADPANHPICYTFGYTKGGESETGEEKTEAYSGVINVFDAQILLFPVHSMCGPVWVSTRQRLQDAGFKINNANGAPHPETEPPELGTCLTSWRRNDPLNLGWLMLTVGGQAMLTAPSAWEQAPPWQGVRNRLVLISEALFSQVVNSNLEIRTSVSIDPWRGAAAEKALFTYEALPRATFLVLDIVLDDYRQNFPSMDKYEKLKTLKWKGPGEVFTAGLELLAWLGVGGMGTRGFGRLARIGEPEKIECSQEACHE